MLTDKMESACQEYVICCSKSDAYRHAYNTKNMKNEVVNNKASILFARDDVRVRVKELQDALNKQHNITKESIINDLKDIVSDYKEFKEFAKNPNNVAQMRKAEVLASYASSPSAIAALKQISKMCGFDAPEKIEVDHNVTININKPKD